MTYIWNKQKKSGKKKNIKKKKKIDQTLFVALAVSSPRVCEVLQWARFTSHPYAFGLENRWLKMSSLTDDFHPIHPSIHPCVEKTFLTCEQAQNTFKHTLPLQLGSICWSVGSICSPQEIITANGAQHGLKSPAFIPNYLTLAGCRSLFFSVSAAHSSHLPELLVADLRKLRCTWRRLFRLFLRIYTVVLLAGLPPHLLWAGPPPPRAEAAHIFIACSSSSSSLTYSFHLFLFAFQLRWRTRGHSPPRVSPINLSRQDSFGG